MRDYKRSYIQALRSLNSHLINGWKKYAVAFNGHYKQEVPWKIDLDRNPFRGNCVI